MKFYLLFISCLFMSWSAFGQSEVFTCNSSSQNDTRSVPADDCIISGPATIPLFGTVTYSVDVTGQCPQCYDWDVSGPAEIVGSDQNATVDIRATGFGEIYLRVTLLTEDGCIECCIPLKCMPEPCCFNFWVTPKWFPDCFTECNGNLDNVVELHYETCASLPEGYTSAITGLELLSSATLGNCHQCDTPVTSLPEGSAVSSANIAVCGPLNHAVLVDITVYDPHGNPIAECTNNYFRFTVDECPGDPFRLSPGQGSTGESELNVNYKSLDHQLTINGTGLEAVRTVVITDHMGQPVQTLSVGALFGSYLQLDNIDLPINKMYTIQLLNRSGELIQAQKIMSLPK